MDASIYLREDTIAALSTAEGRGAIALIRISGPDARTIAARLFVPAGSRTAPERHMTYGTLRDPQTDEVIDDIMQVEFHASRTYTGEDLVEWHTHGSEAIVRRVLSMLYREGARPAEPGEFTFRAVRNGRMDLAQAEAVSSLIDSRSQLARALSRRMLDGEFSQRLHAVRESIITALVEVETVLEFPDEATEEELAAGIEQQLNAIVSDAQRIQQSAVLEQRFSQGIIVVLAGRPNVGKSSLFNRILGRDRAIVSPHAGTTRDSLEGAIELQGRPVTLVDTAGLRETREEIEHLGIERSRELLTSSHIALMVYDASQPLTPEEQTLLDELEQSPDCRVVLVANKSDLCLQPPEPPRNDLLWTTASATAPDGTDNLLSNLTNVVNELVPDETDSAFVVSVRQEETLARMLRSLEASLKMVQERAPLEVCAEEARLALHAIAELDGTGIAPDIMTTIFSRFCIGK